MTSIPGVVGIPPFPCLTIFSSFSEKPRDEDLFSSSLNVWANHILNGYEVPFLPVLPMTCPSFFPDARKCSLPAKERYFGDPSWSPSLEGLQVEILPGTFSAFLLFPRRPRPSRVCLFVGSPFFKDLGSRLLTPFYDR